MEQRFTCFMCVSDCTDGIEFFWSENRVLLTAGDTEGKLLPKYFIRALRLRPSKKNYHMDYFNLDSFHLKFGLRSNIFLFTEVTVVLCFREHPAAAVAEVICSVIDQSRTHLTVLASHGWLMLILVPLVTLVVWQEHPSGVISVSNRRIHSQDHPKWD